MNVRPAETRGWKRGITRGATNEIVRQRSELIPNEKKSREQNIIRREVIFVLLCIMTTTAADGNKKDYRGFVFVVHQNHGLLLLHCTRKKNKPPHWQLPGGHVDQDEFDTAGT